jgi:hypothetical protein
MRLTNSVSSGFTITLSDPAFEEWGFLVISPGAASYGETAGVPMAGHGGTRRVLQ